MAPTVIQRQYVQGTGVPNGGVMQVQSQYFYDLTLACPTCTVTTRLNASWSQPTAELVITQDSGPSGNVTQFLLEDPSSHYTIANYQHMCYPSHTPSYVAEMDLPGWMRRIEEKLNTRFVGEQELVRLTGTVQMLTEKLKWTTEELHATKGRNTALAQQIRKLHALLDCPCEHDELDTTDLVGHFQELGVF